MKLQVVLLLSLAVFLIQVNSQCPSEFQDPEVDASINISLIYAGQSGSNHNFMLQLANKLAVPSQQSTNGQFKGVNVVITNLDLDDLYRSPSSPILSIAEQSYEGFQFNVPSSDLNSRVYAYINFKLNGQKKTYLKSFILVKPAASRDVEEEESGDVVTIKAQDSYIQWNTTSWTGTYLYNTAVPATFRNIGSVTLYKVTYMCNYPGGGDVAFQPTQSGNVVNSVSASTTVLGALVVSGNALGTFSVVCEVKYRLSSSPSATIYTFTTNDNTWVCTSYKKAFLGFTSGDSTNNNKLYASLAGVSAFVAVVAVVAAVAVVRRRNAVASRV